MKEINHKPRFKPNHTSTKNRAIIVGRTGKYGYISVSDTWVSVEQYILD